MRNHRKKKEKKEKKDREYYLPIVEQASPVIPETEGLFATDLTRPDYTAEQLEKRKHLVVELKDNNGRVHQAVAKINAIKGEGWVTSTAHNWMMNKDEEYRMMMNIIEQLRIDKGEEMLDELVCDKNIVAVKFLLETKGKDRGYGINRGNNTNIMAPGSSFAMSLPKADKAIDITPKWIGEDEEK